MPKGLNKTIDVKANLSIDATQAKTQLKALQKDITKISQSMSLTSLNGQAGITAELTNAVKLTSQLSSALKNATNNATGNLDLTKFNDSLRQSGTTLKDYQTTLNSLGDDGTKAFSNLNKAILSAEAPALRTTSAVKETLATLGNTVRWQATSSLMHGITGTINQAISYVKRLDTSLNNIQIVTGKSADTMAKFAKSANEAAKNLSVTTNEYAKAALIYYQQGLSDSQVEGRVETTLKLANVSGQTAAKVSDQMTSIWNNFYDGSKSLEYYADVMTALGASTATSSKEIATGLSKFSSIAKTTGLSYEYATSALATITAATRQSADSVGTSLKTMFSRLQGLNLGATLDDGTTLNKYSKALLAVGVNIKEANGQLKTMDNILNELGSKWQGLKKDTQIALAQTVGGVRNYTSLLTLMNNWDQFRVNLGTARMSEGALQKQADIYAESWEAASTRVRAASESIYKNLIDDKVFTAATNNMANTLETIGKVTDAMGGFKGVLLSTAGVATQLFGGEISQAISNVGYNIRSVVTEQADVQALRQEALRNLLTPNYRMDNIEGDIETTLNKNLVDRLTTYQTKVDQGKIAEWQTAAYQQLLSKAAEQDAKTLAALEKSADIDTANSRYGYNFGFSLRTAANNITDKALKDAAETFLEGPNKNRAGGLSAYEDLVDIAKTSTILEDLNTKYWKAIPAETGIAKSVGAMKNLTGTIMQLGAGAKELNISFKELVGDKDTAIQLESMYNHLNQFIEKTGPITESNLRKYQDFFENTYGNFGETLEYALNKSEFGGQGYSNKIAELQDTLVNVFGYSSEQANQTINQIQANSRAAGEASYTKIMNVGASIESNQAIMDQINSNTRKHLDMSEAITDQIALFTSSAAAYGTVVETLNTLTSGSASVTDRIVALGTSFGTLKSAMSAAGNIFENFNSQIDIFGKASPLTVGGLTAISGAAVGLVNIGQTAIQAYQDSTIEAQINSLQEAAVFAKEQSSIATDSYETLLSSASNYNTLLSELYTLRSGTSDFTQTLLSTNEAALNLVDTYGLTATRGNYGEILLDSQELQEKTAQYEEAALQAQTRSLISSQSSNYFEQQAIFNRLHGTTLYDKNNNLGVTLNNIGSTVGNIAGQIIDVATAPLQYIFPADQKGISQLKENTKQLFNNIGDSILIGAEKLITGIDKTGLLSDQFDDAARATLKSYADNTTFKDLVNNAGQLTVENLSKFYNMHLENYEKGLSTTIKDYSTFKDYYRISDITVGYRAPVNWAGVVGEDGKINWKLAQEKLGESLSNLIPQSFESILKSSLGLKDNATDEEIGQALSDFEHKSQSNVLKLEAITANMVSNTMAGEEQVSRKQQLASQLLSANGVNYLGQLIPSTIEALRTKSLEDLQSQYYDTIKPLNNDYLDFTKEQLISAIQSEQIRTNILNQVDKIAAKITNDDLKIIDNYQSLSIGELSAALKNTKAIEETVKATQKVAETAKETAEGAETVSDAATNAELQQSWLNFYNYQSAISIKNLGEALLTSLSPEALTREFGQIDLSDSLENNFGKALTQWVIDKGYDLQDVQDLANWTSSMRSTFGEGTAEYAFQQLSKTQGTLDSVTQRALRMIDLESSLTAVASLKTAREGVSDSSLREILDGFYDKITTDIGGESGLFNKLLESSDFVKVSNSLQKVYQETGQISASLVQALSSKSSSLNAYLKATDTGNAGSVANILSAMYHGSIGQEDLTNSVMDMFGYATSGTGTQASRQADIKDYDFEDSSASIVNKWLKNAGANVKTGWNNGYLTDPAVMQIMNLTADSTRSLYYSLMESSINGEWGARSTLQTFKNQDPAAARFFNAISKGKGTINDVITYIQQETGLFSTAEDDLFKSTYNGYELNAAMKDSIASNQEYLDYIFKNFKEFRDTSGKKVDVDYLFQSSQGYQRLMEDYLMGKIPGMQGKSQFGQAGAEFFGNMLTEYAASTGSAQKWDAVGIKKALDDIAYQGFIKEDVLRAFYEENIENNPNPLISGQFKDFEDFKTGSLQNVDIIDKDYWNNNGSFRKIFGNRNHLYEMLEAEGAMTEEGIDLYKTINYFQNALGMTQDQAIKAIEENKFAFKTLGAWIVDANNQLKFVTYKDWAEDVKDNNTLEDFYKLVKDQNIADTVKGFTSNFFNSIKETLGLMNYDTAQLEKDFNDLFLRASQDGVGGILDFFGEKTFIGKAIKGIGEVFSNIANGFVEFFTDHNLEWYQANKGNILDIGKDVIKGAVDDLKKGAPKIANLLANVLGIENFEWVDIRDANGTIIGKEQAYKSTKQLWSEIGSTVADNVKGALGGALNFIDTLLDWDFMVSDDSGDGYDLTQSVKNFGSQVFSIITTGIANFLSGTEQYLVGKNGLITRKIFDENGKFSGFEVVDNLTEVWEDIGNTFINFVTDTVIPKVSDYINNTVIPQLTEWGMTGLSSLDNIFEDTTFFNPDATFVENLASLGNDILGRVLAGISGLVTGEKVNIASIITDGKIDLNKASFGLRKSITPFLEKIFGDNLVYEMITDEEGNTTQSDVADIGATISNVKDNIVNGFQDFLYNIYDMLGGKISKDSLLDADGKWKIDTSSMWNMVKIRAKKNINNFYEGMVKTLFSPDEAEKVLDPESEYSFWDALGARIKGLPQEIVDALVPKGIDVSSILGKENANIFDALSVGLTARFAQLVDNLTGGQFDAFNRYKSTKDYGFKDIAQELFSTDGLRAVGTTLSTVVTSALGKAGENLLDFFTVGGKSGYTYIEGEGFFRKDQLNEDGTPKDKETGRGFFDIFSDIATQGLVNAVTGEGYHAFNGKLYREQDWDSERGVPKGYGENTETSEDTGTGGGTGTGGDTGTGGGTTDNGVSPEDAMFAKIISTLTGNNYVPTSSGIYLGSDVDLETMTPLEGAQPFTIGNFVSGLSAQIGEGLRTGMLGGLEIPTSTDILGLLAQATEGVPFIGKNLQKMYENALDADQQKEFDEFLKANNLIRRSDTLLGEYYTGPDGQGFYTKEDVLRRKNGEPQLTSSLTQDELNLYNTFGAAALAQYKANKIGNENLTQEDFLKENPDLFYENIDDRYFKAAENLYEKKDIAGQGDSLESFTNWALGTDSGKILSSVFGEDGAKAFLDYIYNKGQEKETETPSEEVKEVADAATDAVEEVADAATDTTKDVADTAKDIADEAKNVTDTSNQINSMLFTGGGGTNLMVPMGFASQKEFSNFIGANLVSAQIGDGESFYQDRFGTQYSTEEMDNLDKIANDFEQGKMLNYEDFSTLMGAAEEYAFNAEKQSFNEMSAEERLDYIGRTQEQALDKGDQSLTPFQRSLLSLVTEGVEGIGTQVDLAQEAADETSATGGKTKATVNPETGKLEDENGNEIDIPYIGGAGGTRDYSAAYADYSSMMADYVNGTQTGTSTGGYTDVSVPGAAPSSGGYSGGGSSSGPNLYKDLGLTPTGGSGYKTDFGYYDQYTDKEGHQFNFNAETGEWAAANEETQTWVNEQNKESSFNSFIGGGNASGQNNARILQFAEGKQGHIAVTGELGPELIIRENGTVDMLGSHGREYTWVNPNDIIYTAAQTTSILGNNNIKELKQFAEGFNNKIRGHSAGGKTLWDPTAGYDSPDGTWTPTNTYGGGDYSGSSSGGGGRSYSNYNHSKTTTSSYSSEMSNYSFSGSTSTEEEEKDPRYDQLLLKERDLVERYYTILQQIEDITQAVDRFAKVADRAWGEERVQAIEKQTDLYREQLIAQQKYVSEIKDYLEEDEEAMKKMISEFAKSFREETGVNFFSEDGSGTEYEDGQERSLLQFTEAEFDENGVLTNYKELVTAMMEAYNEFAEDNAMSKDAQYKFQEMLKDIQFYTDSLNLYQQQQEQLQQLKNAVLDNQIREIVYKVEYENELDNIALKSINYEFDKIRDNTYRAAEAIDYYATRLDFLGKSSTRYTNEIKDILGVYSSNVTNGVRKTLEPSKVWKVFFDGLDEEEQEILTDMGMIDPEEAKLRKEILDSFDPSWGLDWKDKARDLYKLPVGASKEDYDEWKKKNAVLEDILSEPVAPSEVYTLNHFDNSSIKAPERQDPTTKGQVTERVHPAETFNEKFKERLARTYEQMHSMSPIAQQYADKVPVFEDGKFVWKDLTDLSGTGNDLLSLYSGDNLVETEQEKLLPTKEEVLEYLKNFDIIRIGNQDFYIPKSDEVEINKDIMRQIEIKKPLLDDTGDFSDDTKKMITEQVQAWYDELEDLHPEIVLDVIPEYDEDGFMTNFREVKDAINEANSHMSDEMYDLFLNDTETFFKKWADINLNNSSFQDLTAETVKKLESDMDAEYQILKEKKKQIELAVNSLADIMKDYNKQLNAQIDEFDYFNEVALSYESIINLTNRRATNIGQEFMNLLRGTSLDNAINKVSGTYKVYNASQTMAKSAQQTYDKDKNAFEAYKNYLLSTMSAEEAAQDQHYKFLEDKLLQSQNVMDTVNNKLEDAHQQFLQAWENALSKIQENYKKAIEESIRVMEESISPYFNTLDLLMAQYEREKALEDYYVDDYQRIHDLSKLNRDIAQSILDTDNLKGKSRLRELQEEINQRQKEGTKLSEYDLDLLQKKYEVELARQALEDSKNSKSLVRLARDNNGNWSYVYTSDEANVEKAEQDYENAIYAMEQANERYSESLQDQILQNIATARDAIRNLDITAFANEEQYTQAIQSIMDGAKKTGDYLAEQLKNAWSNNDWLDPYIIDQFDENLHNLTNEWTDMTLSGSLGTQTIESTVSHINDLLNNLQTDAIKEFIKYSEQQAKVYQEAGVDIENAEEFFTNTTLENAETSNAQLERTIELTETLTDKYVELGDKVKEFNEDIFLELNAVEIFLDKLADFIKYSGEYVPSERLDFTDAIDTERELQEIKKSLAEYGKIIVTDYDEEGKQRIYELEQGTEETKAQFEVWKDEILKKKALDVGEDLDSQKEYDQIKELLEQHGEYYIKINDELRKIVSDNEEDMAWLEEKLTAIEEAAKANGDLTLDYDEELHKLLEAAKATEPDSPEAKALADYIQSKQSIGVNSGDISVASSKAINIQTDPSTTIQFSHSSQGNVTDYSSQMEKYKGMDTGGYTGRWQYADTGMYTGEWDGGSERKNGRLAWLHQKELVLNAHDTENFLDAMNIVRQLDNLASWMANGLGDLFMPRVEGNDETLEQNVHIEASFPNAVDHNEIEQAFGNLVNLASQYANRKAFA